MTSDAKRLTKNPSGSLIKTLFLGTEGKQEICQTGQAENHH